MKCPYRKFTTEEITDKMVIKHEDFEECHRYECPHYDTRKRYDRNTIEICRLADKESKGGNK